MSFDLQPLESRRLLSASPLRDLAGMFTDPTIIADRQAVNAAMKTFVTDQRAGRETIRADQQAVRAEYQDLIEEKGQETVDAALQPLKDKLRADEKAKNKELRAAGQELSALKRTWAKTILADLKAWRQARVAGDDAAAEDAKAKLDADKQAAQEALKPIRDEILAIKDKWRPIITADHDAITAKLEELNPALEPLYDKLDADTAALNAKLKADAQAVADASAKLAADIEAYKAAHA